MLPEKPARDAVAHHERLVFGAFIVTVLVGGANSIAVRFSLRELPPFWGATFRFCIATVVVGALVLVAMHVRTAKGAPLPQPTRRHALPIAAYGLLNFGLTYVFLYTGLRDAPAATGAVITGLAPLLTLLFAIAHRSERFRPAALTGAVTASAGIAVVFANQVSLAVPPLALVALVAAAACLAETGVLMKRHPPGDPLVAVALGMPIGAACLAALSLVAGERWFIPTHPETWLATAYLVAFGTIVAFTLNLFVLARWTASANSYAYILSPLVTVLLGGLLLGEPVHPVFLAGGALVLVGVAVATRARTRAARAPGAPDEAPLDEPSP